MKKIIFGILGAASLVTVSLSAVMALTNEEKVLEKIAIAEANKKIVVDFYQMAFRDHKAQEAADQFIGDTYTQHNPLVPDGKEAFTGYFVPFFAQHPEARSEIKRAIAENDLVVLHVHSKMNKDDLGRAIVDIFRVKDGKIIEHWDVIQAVPEKSANKNSMF